MANADWEIKKAEEVLGKVDLNWSNESTATAGIGYAILTLAKALQGENSSQKE